MHVFESVRVPLCVRPSRQGLTTLDLGCGSGRDVYVMAQLVGPAGTVIGIDMTGEGAEQLSKACQPPTPIPLSMSFSLRHPDEQLAAARHHGEWLWPLISPSRTLAG